MSDKFSFGPFRFDQSRNVLLAHEDRVINLSPNLIKLLQCLLFNRGKTVRREQLAEAIWSAPELPDDIEHTLHQVVSRLKAKLRQYASAEIAQLIVAVPG